MQRRIPNGPKSPVLARRASLRRRTVGEPLATGSCGHFGCMHKSMVFALRFSGPIVMICSESYNQLRADTTIFCLATPLSVTKTKCELFKYVQIFPCQDVGLICFFG